MFDASIIANVLHISDGFHTAPFAIIASHTVSRRVFGRSVALAASCSSDVSYMIMQSNMTIDAQVIKNQALRACS